MIRRGSSSMNLCAVSPARSTASAADTMLAPDTDDDLEQCGWCGEDITRGHGPPEVYRGMTIHKHCRKHARYVEDQARKSKALAGMRQYRAQHGDDFRWKMRDLVGTEEQSAGGGKQRGSFQRTQVKCLLNEFIEFEKNSFQKPVLFLGQRAYFGMTHARDAVQQARSRNKVGARLQGQKGAEAD